MKSDFNKDLEIGLKYQDEVLYTITAVLKIKVNGKPIIPLTWASAHYQLYLGEGYHSIEVKRNSKTTIDGKLGNIYIATLENGLKKETGILQTKCDFYAIGNEHICYIFKTEDLRIIYNRLKRGVKCSNYYLYNNGDKEGIIIKRDCLRDVMREYRKDKYDLNDYLVTAIPVYRPFLYNEKIYPVNAYKDDKQAEMECKKLDQVYRGIQDIIER